MGRVVRFRHIALTVNGDQVSFDRGDELPDELPKKEVDRLDEVGALEPAASDESYDDMKVEDLEQLAADRDLEVVGTGKDGNVLKQDLVDALNAHDQES